MTQELAAEQLGIAAWEKEMLAAGLSQAGLSSAQENTGIFPEGQQPEGSCGMVRRF